MIQKRIVNIASYQRIDSLILSLKSIYDQCDVINVCLNNHVGDIPDYLLLPKINLTLTDNSKGDAFKFLYLKESDGYFLTIDDDLLYPPNYVEYMISKSKEYGDKKIITLHGRNFSKFPIQSYYRSSTERYQCLGEVKNDVKILFGGTGVMCFHTSLLKNDINDFYYPNMADVWIGKFAIQSGLEIICVSHKTGYIRELPQKTTIYNTESKNDVRQTSIVNEIFGYGKKIKNFNIIIISTFWNAGNHVRDSINSIKNQNFINFNAYFIDDMSTDKSYEIAKQAIGDDNRFILIKNTNKKYKTKNFIDIIRDNPNIHNNDVIVEIDGDDQLSDSTVLNKISQVFEDNNIWLCGTKWKDKNGNLGNYVKPNPEKARSTSWNFSHMRSFRAFLFRQIKDEHLKMNGVYFKGACDIGHAIPMLEMSGSEHFHYINEPLYTYTWHNQQSYSEKGGIGDKITQSITGAYIYRLPKYGKLLITETKDEETFKFEERKKDVDTVLGNILNLKNKKPETSVDYGKINEIISKKGVYDATSSIKPVRQNTPKDRNELMKIKKGPISEQMNKMFPGKPNRRGDAPNIFSNTKKK